MSDKLKVYIAGPYTHPDPVENTHKAIHAGDRVLRLGYTPFIPHINLLWHMLCPHDPKTWYNWDIEWLKVCAVLVRLPGESVGADEEVKIAGRLGIPVLYGWEAFESWHYRMLMLKHGIINTKNVSPASPAHNKRQLKNATI